jgi:hypothetical protein
MTTRGLLTATACTALALLTTTAKPAAAQLHWTVVGVGEFDTDDAVLVLGGVSVGPAGSGWSPVFGATVAWLEYPLHNNNNETREIIRFVPSVGIRNGFSGGSYQFRVGYAFRDANDEDGDEITGVPPIAADVGDDGITNSVLIDYWGTGKLNAQLIGTYSYGSESLWSRARVTQRVIGLSGDGHIRAGVETAYLTGEDYNAWQVGGVVGFQADNGTIINGSIGQKLASGDADNATYFRAEIVLVPWR